MPITTPTIDVLPILPQAIIGTGALLALVADLALPRERMSWLAALSLAVLVMSGVAAAAMWGINQEAFAGMVMADAFSLFFDLVILIGAGLAILLSPDYLRREGLNRGEYYVLVLLATTGMMLLGAAGDLLMVFLAIETLSLALYVLAGFARGRPASEEAALKYFLLGAFASAFLLYGIALLYGSTGTTSLSGIAAALGQSGGLLGNHLLLAGVILVLVGLGFKLALVPFQMWTPDAYQGAPTPVTAFMSVGTKAAALAALIRVSAYSLASLQVEWAPILAGLAALTMIVGNTVALRQSNIKRLLAYSSIAHAGYILVGVVTGTASGFQAALFYVVAYTVMNVGAFAVVIALEEREANLSLGDYAGLSARAPLLAATMALFMFALAGFPLTAGFLAKFYVFSAAVAAGYTWLALVGVLTSVISVFYYTGVVATMYMQATPAEPAPLHLSPALVTALAVAAWGTLQLGLFPGPLIDLAGQALVYLP